VILKLQSDGFTALSRFHQIGPVLLAVIQQQPEFESLLNELGAEWRFEGLIHGDLKLGNILVFPAPNNGFDFRLVDWEETDFGDPGWDVGGILQTFLMMWILSMPIASGLPPELYVGMAGQPIESMRPMLRDFWDAYADARGFAEHKRKLELERSMRFAAARLVWTAAEQCVYQTEFNEAAIAMLQVSLNILKDPGQAVADVLEA